MKYSELEDVVNFHRNMRRTPWLKLFPHWWDEKDALLNAIGDEIERIKAQAIFALLNAGIKPPVLLWQESLNNKKYNVQKNITKLPADIKIDAPLYKTWGKITLINNTSKDIDGLELTLDATNGFIINQLIKKEDKITIDLYNNTVHINGKKIRPQKKGEGMPYFITSANYKKHHTNTPLHNEVVRLHINTDTNLENTTVTNTVNITEKVESWDVNGEAYQENPDDADPWIIINGKGRIGYELNFNNIDEISFWYKAEDTAEFACYCNHEGVFNKDINDEWTYYQIDTSKMEGTEKIEFENFLYDTKVYINDIKYVESTLYNFECDIDVDIELDNAVFINEQNIEVTSLELIPIEKIELYAYYDFPFNQQLNGWKKVYQKVYEENTNVIYDMITTQFPTKEFYVDVWFKTLQYPYKVGFPCYRDAEPDSMYHVNNRLDTHGLELGLERRMYKEDIPEEDYPTTFPIFYPFDIEQDYWYYLRLVNEYTWNDLAINDVDIVDTDGDRLFRLYSINPFCDDFVVHAKSSYPKDKEKRDCNWYTPKLVSQRQNNRFNHQVGFDNVINLLTKDNDSAYLSLTNQNGQYISTKTYQSKELWTYFDLSDLPEDVNIDNIEVEIEAESTDNKTNKYTTSDTGILIPNFNSNENSFIPLTTESNYQLKKQVLTYSNDDIQTYINTSEDDSTHERIVQKAVIGEFSSKVKDFVDIPFTLYQGYLDKDGVQYNVVDDITTVYLYYNNNLKQGSIIEEHNKTYIHAYVPNEPLMDTITIICKSRTHKPFTCIVNVTKKNKFKVVDEETNFNAPTISSTNVENFIENNKNQLRALYNQILEQYGEIDPKINEAWKNGIKALTSTIETTETNLKDIYNTIKFIVEYQQSAEEIEYQYIEGPLVNGNLATVEYKDEWRTDDFRNLLQKEGLYFRAIFQNDDEQSSTSIYLYNITLKICYSNKKDTFTLNTYVDTTSASKKQTNAGKTTIGKYKVAIENTGEKSLDKIIDIITPPNIYISKNSMHISLAPKDNTVQYADIMAEYPLIDGYYDIVTICEDKIKKNSVQIFSDGLIETGVKIKPHHGKYYDTIELSADVYAIDNSKISGGANKVAFYINGYMVGSPVQVINGHAEIKITPGHYKFIDTGILRLEAHYLGNVKYKTSRNYSTIFISKSNTRITLTASNKAIYHGAYQVEAKVEYFNGEKYLPVNDGEVTFYIGDEILSANSTFANGIFTSKINFLENPAGKYILRATYTGSDIYSSTETTQEIEIIGGEAKIFIPDIKAKPTDKITFKATVTDINNKVIPYGFLDFYIENPNKTLIQKNVKIENGIAVTNEWNDTTVLATDDEKKIYTITAIYHGASDVQIYDGEGTGSLIIEKGKVVIEYQPTYYASQREPLGFFMRIRDADTYQYISDGTITITLPKQNNLKLSGTIDEDGGLRIVHNPLSFTAKEWQDLNKISFTTAGEITTKQRAIINDTSILESIGIYDEDKLYMIYDNIFNNDKPLIDFGIKNDILYYEGDKEDKDHIFMSDTGHLYARTALDSLRMYTGGLQDIIIDYKSQSKYKPQNFIVEDGLNIQTQSTDLDIHSYDITYSDNEQIICYVTKYDTIDNQTTTTNINTGSVQFVIDDATVGIVDVLDGIAILNKDALYNIKAGNHLLSVKYHPNKNKNNVTTYSYEKLLLKKATPVINLEIDRVTKNRKSNIYVTLSGNDNIDIPLSGLVNLYIDDILVDNQFLYGNEQIPGLVDYIDSVENLKLLDTNGVYFTYIMPDDIDINSHTITVKYEGNDYFTSASTTEIIKQEPALVDISVRNLKSSGFYVALGEECSIDVDVSVSDDIISEGRVILLYGDKEISSGGVIDNVATLTWTQENATNYQYTLSYVDGKNYKKKEDIVLDINVIEPYDSITIPNDKCDTLEEALRCIKNNGTIYINEDIIINRPLNIKKDCNIIGANNSSIIKDAVDLVINTSSIYTYNSYINEGETMYEIPGVNIYNLNKNNFVVQDNKLFFRKDNELQEVYLFEDNKFYSSTPITLNNINADININVHSDAIVHIDNIIFKSNDNSKKNDFIIQNNGTLVINRSILNQEVVLKNNGRLTAQRNFMYCSCIGEGDLNNNWWGSNTAPYNVDSNIIIEVNNNITPAVISENINITGRMIGSNGRKYDLPSASFLFSTDTEGYFSIDNGVTTNQEVSTILLDAVKEGNVYFTVDNETVSCPVYEYERKTEVIIDEIHAIPIRYQIPISAKVQSCADVFYTFKNTDEGITTEKSTELINDGDIYFYIDNKQLGHAPVKNGEASINVFFTDNYYNVNQDYTIKAVYKPKDYYFTSESTFNTTIIDDNEDVCYVSSLGSSTNSGTYAYPVKTIQQAINKNKSTIYLLDEYIKDSSINITKNVTIQAYKNQSIFQRLSSGEINALFTIEQQTTLNLKNIDLINNSFNYLFDNKGTLHIEKCIFYKNRSTLFDNKGELDTRYSVIVDNRDIANNIQSSNFAYCWFGTNNIDNINSNIDNYVIMSIEASKNILYIGTLAHITGELLYYVSGDNKVKHKLQDTLPLRVAKFSTDIGSMKPLHDYTYNNKSSSLLNTYEKNNTTQYVIYLLENKNYYNKDTIIQAHINNAQNDVETSSNNNIVFEITGNNTNLRETTKKINNNIASVNLGKLELGTYNVKCSFYKNNKLYVTKGEFTVQKPEVILKRFNISNKDNLYYTDVNIQLVDNFNNTLNNETVNIKIDDKLIGSYIINNGTIERRLKYDMLTAGEHTITIYNLLNNAQYEKYSYTKTLTVTKKNTKILFPYNNIEAHVLNNLLITVVDDDDNYVQEGYITVDFDNENILSQVNVENGIVQINDFKINDIGQHSISIYYSGDDHHYNEAFKVCNVGVGIFNVIFGVDQNEYIHADLGKPFNFKTTVTDVTGQNVNSGYINLYIDDILINNGGIPINDGKITFSDELPINIAPETHTFTIEYKDSSNLYMDTILNTFLIIDKIKTDIYMNTIRGSPGQKTIMDYQIISDYGIITTGILTATYDGIEIGSATVTDGSFNQITITSPFLPAGEEYSIKLKYKDTANNYKDSETTVILIMQKNEVVIKPSHTWYYPNQLFHFAGYFTDVDNNIVNVGKASLYIDNVEEREPQNVVNGQIMIPIELTKAKTYDMTLIYEENDYFSYTRYDFKFSIDDISIKDIHLKDTTTESYNITNDVINTLPNKLLKTEIIFDTLDNYNVKDGIISFYLDDQNINNYYVAESNKNVILNIGNIKKGVHILRVEYHDSDLFKDFDPPKKFKLNIIPQQLSITVNNQEPIEVTNHNDIIDINTHLSKETNGIIKYYLGVPIYEGDSNDNIVVSGYNYDKFIGLEEITQQDVTYKYQLSKELLSYAIENIETVYKIKAVFTGNNQYDEASNETDLIIHKQDCAITFLDNKIYTTYRETLNIKFNIDVENNPLITFYIDNEMIGSTVANNENGVIEISTFKYKMNSKMIARPEPYILTAVFDGSAINNPTQSSIEIEVSPMVPRIDTEDKDVYIGGKLELDNQLTDLDNVVVEDTGTLSYKIMSQEKSFNLNEKGDITLPYTSFHAQENLLVSYTPGDATKYTGFIDKKIIVNLIKNDIQLDIEMPNKVSRGETFNVVIDATSKTTNAPVNVPIRLPYKDNNENIVDGRLESSITIPLDTDDLKSFDLEFVIVGNSIFNAQTKQIKINNYNQPEVTINTDESLSFTNTHTLEQAIDLVSNYGNIKLITPIDAQKVTLEKSINLDGQNNTVLDWQIINNANEVTISSLNMKNETSTDSIIINNNEITIDNCSFKNSKTSAIYTTHKMTVTNCIFDNNNSKSGGAIWISCMNYKTIISHCTFTANNVTVYGGAIYSDAGNNVEISYCSFHKNKALNSHGASISCYGNMYLNNNTFYNNNGQDDVHILGGSLEANMNIFNGDIKSVFSDNNNIIMDVDLNYWGYNDLEKIESNNPDIDIENWLIAQRKDYNEEINNSSKHIIVGEISQYLSRLEKDITSIEPVVSDLPVMVGSTTSKLNEKVIANQTAVLKIGQDRFGDLND